MESIWQAHFEFLLERKYFLLRPIFTGLARQDLMLIPVTHWLEAIDAPLQPLLIDFLWEPTVQMALDR